MKEITVSGFDGETRVIQVEDDDPRVPKTEPAPAPDLKEAGK